MDFGKAIEALKEGKKVARHGWNGKNMFLWLKPAAMVKAEWCKDPMLKRLAEEAEALASKEDREYTFDDITIEECYSENRVRIYFPGKPDDEMRENLKRHGFRWAPSMGCWQAYINHWTLRFVNEITQSNQ